MSGAAAHVGGGVVQQSLRDFQSADPAARQAAAAALEAADHLQLTVDLIGVIENRGAELSLRCLACVLLRKKLSRLQHADSAAARKRVEAALQTEVADKLLSLLAATQDDEPAVRKQLLHAISSVNTTAFQGNWPQLWAYVSNAIGDATDTQALQLLPAMLEETSVLPQLSTLIATTPFVRKLCDRMASPSTPLDAKLALLKVASSCCECLDHYNDEAKLHARVGVRLGGDNAQATAYRGSVTTMLNALEPHVLSLFLDLHRLQQTQPLEAALESIKSICDVHKTFLLQHAGAVLQPLQQLVGLHQTQSTLARLAVRLFFHVVTMVVRAGDTSAYALELENQLVTDLLTAVTPTTEEFTCDAEWQHRRETESSDDTTPDSDSIWGVLWESVVGQVQSLGSRTNAYGMLAQVALNFKATCDTQQVAVLRLVESLVVDEVAPLAADIAVKLFCAVVHLLEAQVARGELLPAAARVRWMTMVVMSEILDMLGWVAALHSMIVPVIKCLAYIAARDMVVRCRCRALATLFAVFSAILREFFEGDGCDSENQPPVHVEEAVAPLIPELLSQVIVPCLQTGDPDTHAMAFAVITSLAKVSPKAFSPYCADVFAAIHHVLSSTLNLIKHRAHHLLLSGSGAPPASGADGGAAPPSATLIRDHLSLTDSAVTVGEHLLAANLGELKEQDILDLTQKIMDVTEFCVAQNSSNQQSEYSLFFPSLFSALGRCADRLGAAFEPWLDRYFSCVDTLLNQTEVLTLTEMGTATPVSALSAADLATVMAGKGEMLSENGRERVVWKEANGCEKVLEISTAIVEDKCTALRSILTALPEIRGLWLPYVARSLTLFTKCLEGNYTESRALAAECLVALVTICLPSYDEDDTPYAESTCALATGAVSPADFGQLCGAVFEALTNHLVKTPATATRCLEVVPSISEFFQEVLESINFCSLPAFAPSNAAGYLEVTGEALGRALLLCASEEMHKYTEASGASGASGAGGVSEESEEGDDDEEESLAAAVPTNVMLTLRSLLQIFDPAAVCEQYDKHFQTPFAALLTLPETDTAARAAALVSSGLLAEFGPAPLVKEKLAAQFPLSVLIASNPSVENSDDVNKLQGAAYFIGQMAKFYPDVFVGKGQEAVAALVNLLQMPAADSAERRPATECAAGAIIKIVLSPELGNHFNGSCDVDLGGLFCSIMQEVFPFTEDLDESCTVVDLLLTAVEEKCGVITKVGTIKTAVREALERVVTHDAAAAEKRGRLTSKKTRTSHRIERCLSLLK